MSVKARMRCHNIQDYGTAGKTVQMSPVYDADKSSPNYSYSQATPSGEVYLSITNPDAFNQFEENKVYDLVFTEYVPPEAESAKAA